MNYDKKTDLIRIRVTPAVKNTLKAAARSDGFTLSAFLLRLGRDRARELRINARRIDHPNQSKMFDEGEK